MNFDDMMALIPEPSKEKLVAAVKGELSSRELCLLKTDLLLLEAFQLLKQLKQEKQEDKA
jgi:hypothetical protein